VKGERLGNYVVLGELARGGMATLWVGRHLRLGNIVAIKVLHPQYQRDDQLRTRFVDEARIQANLRHPNILTVQDILELPDASGMVMELLDGCPLNVYLKEVGGRVPPARVLGICLPLAEALAHAHEQGVVHRDLKPSNVYLHRVKSEAIPKLMDFGIAKLAAHLVGSQVTTAGSMLGTPQYMAPEQFEDSSTVDARADQFSLGVMMHEMLTGQVPFAGRTVAEIMRRVLTETAPSLTTLRPELPHVVDQLVLKCLERHRDNRFASSQELAAAIVRAGGEVGIEAIAASEIPKLNLMDKGIDVTTEITSSKLMTRPELATERDKPAQGAAPAAGAATPAAIHAEETEDAPAQADGGTGSKGGQAGNRSVVDSWGTGAPAVPERKSKKLLVVLGLVALAVIGVGAVVLLQPGDTGEKNAANPSAPASEASKTGTGQPPPVEADKAASSGTGAETGPGESVKPDAPVQPAEPPLVDLPRDDRFQLGRWCDLPDTSLSRKVIGARLQGGWRGLRLSELSAERLAQLRLTPSDLETFRGLRAANDTIHEIDELAISASVKNFKAQPLVRGDLDRLAAALDASPDLGRYIEAKTDFLCLSTGKPEKVGALLKEVPPKHGLDAATFRRLDDSNSSDRLVKAEIESRAVCCLMEQLPDR
jgi:serine/threonine protein kinase